MQRVSIAVIFAPLATLFAISLPAADFWQSKAFTEWTDKEVQKILASSPWVRQVTVSYGGSSESSHGNDRHGSTFDDNPGWMSVPSAGEKADVASGKQRGEQAGDEDRVHGASQARLTIQWRSALPIRQALVRAKFGVEASTSPEARQFLEADDPTYVIAVLGMPRAMLTGTGDASTGEALKKALLAGTSLSMNGNSAVNGKTSRPAGSAKPVTSIRPTDIEFRVGAAIDAFFIFPKAAPVTLDDKDVEVSIKLGHLSIAERFPLKEMLFKGNLEL
jgi:hypothetical protein